MTATRMRAGTVDRQATVDRLTRHFTEGRLNPAEFDERVAQAYAATHLDELPVLLADLPEGEQGGRRGGDSRRHGPIGRTPVTRLISGSPSPHARELGRTPTIFAVAAMLGVVMLLVTVGALTYGFFPFPLLWIVLAGFLLTRGHRRRGRAPWSEGRPGGCRSTR